MSAGQEAGVGSQRKLLAVSYQRLAKKESRKKVGARHAVPLRLLFSDFCFLTSVLYSLFLMAVLLLNFSTSQLLNFMKDSATSSNFYFLTSVFCFLTSILYSLICVYPQCGF